MYSEFARLPSAEFEEAKGLIKENVIVSKADFLLLLKKLGLYTIEDDFVAFMAEIDPLFSNKVIKVHTYIINTKNIYFWFQVSSIALEDRFSTDIIEFKLTQIQRPKELIE